MKKRQDNNTDTQVQSPPAPPTPTATPSTPAVTPSDLILRADTIEAGIAKYLFDTHSVDGKLDVSALAKQYGMMAVNRNHLLTMFDPKRYRMSLSAGPTVITRIK